MEIVLGLIATMTVASNDPYYTSTNHKKIDFSFFPLQYMILCNCKGAFRNTSMFYTRIRTQVHALSAAVATDYSTVRLCIWFFFSKQNPIFEFELKDDIFFFKLSKTLPFKFLYWAKTHRKSPAETTYKWQFKIQLWIYQKLCT